MKTARVVAGPFELRLGVRLLSRDGRLARAFSLTRDRLRSWRATTDAKELQTRTVSLQPEHGAEEEPAERRLRERIRSTSWYHTIDLGNGLVTQGMTDHRAQVDRYHIPRSLAGMRCLDVGTWDGFWAFEMERRGAAEVVALDIERLSYADHSRRYREDPELAGAAVLTGRGFAIAHQALASRVERKLCNVYDVSREKLGQFDLIFMSDLLWHLRDPVLALDRLYSVCRGSILIGDVYAPDVETFRDEPLARFNPWDPGYSWWQPNTTALKSMVTAVGFKNVRELDRFVLIVHDVNQVHRAHKVVLRGEA